MSTRINRSAPIETTDGHGRKYILPETAKVYDCARCCTIMVRDRKALPNDMRTTVLGLAGFLMTKTGHMRPLCLYCYNIWMRKFLGKAGIKFVPFDPN